LCVLSEVHAPDKTDLHFISPCAAKLYEVFDSLNAPRGK